MSMVAQRALSKIYFMFYGLYRASFGHLGPLGKEIGSRPENCPHMRNANLSWADFWDLNMDPSSVPECGTDSGINRMITHSPVINGLKHALGPEYEPRSGVADSSDHCFWRWSPWALAIAKSRKQNSVLDGYPATRPCERKWRLCVALC